MLAVLIFEKYGIVGMADNKLVVGCTYTSSSIFV
jgi:hypothetical protein